MTAHRIDISDLVKKCQSTLIDSIPHPIAYQDKVKLKNNTLPPSLGKTPLNIYALWVRREEEPQWKLMYIGQRSAKQGWHRVKQHLFSTPKGTQSKLHQVRMMVESGAEMGVTSLLVEPDSMRLSIEEELINLNSKLPTDLPWNDKARAKSGKKPKA